MHFQVENNTLRTEQPKRAKNIELGLFLCSPALQAQKPLKIGTAVQAGINKRFVIRRSYTMDPRWHPSPTGDLAGRQF